MNSTISPEESLNQLITNANRIVVMQADNPDGDSLGSALALEHILGDMGKDVTLYCGVDIPTYLQHHEGWDRVTREIPNQFDLSIIVDTSAISLFESLQKNQQLNLVATKPCLVIDHHNSDASIPFATQIYNKPAVATGEIIYELAQQFNWPLNSGAKNMIAVSILSDSLGMMSEGTSARSIAVISELVGQGVSLAKLENARRDTMRKKPELVKYKGELLQRIEYFDDNRIAVIVIPWTEIERYSHDYNPSMLVMDDMRLTEGTDIVIAFKVYKDGKVTAKIRCNYGASIADKLAEQFGGGGHRYASGFKITQKQPFTDTKAATVAKATELLATLRQEKNDEALQH